MTDRPARLVTGLIGTGPMACVIARALNNAGHTVALAAPWPPGLDDDEHVRTHLSDVPLTSPAAVARSADLLLVLVDDEEVPAVAKHLLDEQAWAPGQIVLHTGFAAGVSLLRYAAQAHVLPVCVAPVIDFLGQPIDAARFHGSPVIVTGPHELRPVAEALVIEMGAEPTWVGPHDEGAVRSALALVDSALSVAVGDALKLMRGTDVEDSLTLVAATVQSRAELLGRGEEYLVTEDRAVPEAATVRQALRILGQRAGGATRDLQVQLYRSQVTAAVLDGRMRAENMTDVLDVLEEKAEPPADV